MKLQTKYFGEIEYEAADCLHFPNGLFGFEDEKSFLFLPFEGGSAATLFSLQSTQTPALAFLAMDPFVLRPDYEPSLQPAELKALGAENIEALCFYVLCAVKAPASATTVNLKCPLVINPSTLVAYQVILDTDQYQMRHLLSEFSQDGGNASC